MMSAIASRAAQSADKMLPQASAVACIYSCVASSTFMPPLQSFTPPSAGICSHWERCSL